MRLGRTICIAGFILVACGPSIPPVPTEPRDDPAFAPPAAVELPGLPNDPPVAYTVLPGDIVRLRTSSVDPLDLPDLIVDPSGRIHVPLAGDVEVGGRSISDAEKRVEEALQPHDRFARVNLAITSPGGQRATVTGAVAKPGVYEIKPNARVADVMALAGGPKTFEAEGESYEMADIEGARIVRDGVALPVSFGQALLGNRLHNVRLRAGDLVYVPPAHGRRVAVLGDVHSPKSVPFRRGIRLTEVLAAAGGTTKDADNADVRVIRGPLSHPKVYRANFRALVAGKTGDVELAPGDVIFVTEHWFATTTDIINRLTPVLAGAALGAAFIR